jgi:hypothetical protein
MTSRYKIDQPIRAALGAWAASKPGSEASHHFAVLEGRIDEACQRAADAEREKAIALLAAAQRAFRLIDDYSNALTQRGANVDGVKQELLAAIAKAEKE